MFDVAADHLALRIRKSGPPIGDMFTPWGLRDSHCRYVHHNRIRPLGAWRQDQNGMRPRTDPHCAFAKWGPRIGEYASGPSNLGAVALSTVTLLCD